MNAMVDAARSKYEDSAEFEEMKERAVSERLMRIMVTLAKASKSGVDVAALAWIEAEGAGHPDIPLVQERIRDDASLWAMTANQVELECYLAAALLQLEKSALTSRACKRLAALSWRRMGLEDQEAFRAFIKKEEKTHD